MGQELEATLNERHGSYGSFVRNAEVAQFIKRCARESPKWLDTDPDQREAIDQIACKLSRILTGDPNHIDSWHDIAGYATLVADRLRGKVR